jgi:NAD(P)H-nitrite reductase large subunit
VARRFVLVGNGPASLAAAEAIRLRDAQAEILILGEEPHAFYSRPGLAYYLAGHIPESQLYSRPDEEYRRLNVRRRTARAVGLEPLEHRVHLHDGRSLTYDALLLAVGAHAVRPKVTGIDLQGVVTLDTLEDARRIVALARRARRAVVVGGGITALELAEGLAARGVETHYLLRRDRYWSNVLDPDESDLVEARLEAEGIRLHHNTNLAEIIGRGGRVVGAELTPGGRMACEIVAVAVGITPRIDLAAAAGLEVKRGIVVDPHLAASAEGVFAAGDVAEVLDPDTGEYVLDSLWWLAIEQGKAAGANMAGSRGAYRKGTPFNVTRIGGLTTTVLGCVGQPAPDDDLIGIARGDSEVWRRQPDASAVEADDESSRLRVMVGRKHILGGLVMGDQRASRPLQDLISNRVDITMARNRLLSSREGLFPVIEETWESWKRGGRGVQA